MECHHSKNNNALLVQLDLGRILNNNTYGDQLPRTVVPNLGCSWIAVPRSLHPQLCCQAFLGIAIQKHLGYPRLGTTDLEYITLPLYHLQFVPRTHSKCCWWLLQPQTAWEEDLWSSAFCDAVCSKSLLSISSPGSLPVFFMAYFYMESWNSASQDIVRRHLENTTFLRLRAWSNKTYTKQSAHLK